METLADELMKEITRVRDLVLPRYLELGQAGAFAAALMRKDVDDAVRALAEQNATDCLRLLKSLQEYCA